MQMNTQKRSYLKSKALIWKHDETNKIRSSKDIFYRKSKMQMQPQNGYINATKRPSPSLCDEYQTERQINEQDHKIQLLITKHDDIKRRNTLKQKRIHQLQLKLKVFSPKKLVCIIRPGGLLDTQETESEEDTESCSDLAPRALNIETVVEEETVGDETKSDDLESESEEDESVEVEKESKEEMYAESDENEMFEDMGEMDLTEIMEDEEEYEDQISYVDPQARSEIERDYKCIYKKEDEEIYKQVYIKAKNNIELKLIEKKITIMRLKIYNAKELKHNLLKQIMKLRHDLRAARFQLMDLKVSNDLHLNVGPKCSRKTTIRKCNQRKTRS